MEITDTLWMAWSTKGDIDEAWDAAKESSLSIFGSLFPATALYASDFEVASGPRPLGYWWRHGQGQGTLRALPLARTRDWTQRSVRVRYQGVDVSWPVGSKSALSDEVVSDEVVMAVLGHEGVATEAGEVITSVVLSASRSRKKAVVTRYPAPSEKVFELRTGEGALVATSPKSGPLVSSARSLIKEHEELNVWGRAGRAGGEPLVHIVPEVLRASATLRVTLGKEKDSDQTSKIGGWFFVGPRDLLSLHCEAPSLGDQAGESGDAAGQEAL